MLIRKMNIHSIDESNDDDNFQETKQETYQELQIV